MSKRPASKERPREDREASPESSKRRIEYGAKIKAHVNPKKFLPEDIGRLREELRECKYSDKICQYCSTRNWKIRHHHFSTIMQKDFTAKWIKGDHMCPICQKLESFTVPSGQSLRVVLADSTLFGIWNHPEISKVAEHFEIECIVGGRVRDLTRALEMNILCHNYVLEIVVVAGINNVAEGQEASFIIEEFKDMKRAVHDHNLKFRKDGERKSYVSISTLCLPPKLCSFTVPDCPTLAEWKPPPNFIDRYDTIKQVNEAVKQINLDEGINYLNIHMHGVKMLRNGPQHKFDTREGSAKIWREREVFKKLHFTSDNKLKLIKYLQNTFKNNSRP